MNGTTDAAFGKILNEWLQNIGMTTRFTIYDTKDFAHLKSNKYGIGGSSRGKPSQPRNTELGHAQQIWRNDIENWQCAWRGFHIPLYWS